MELYGRTILFCSDFAAPYKGNFIKAMEALAARLTQCGCKVCFLFPVSCQNQPWWADFCSKHYATCVGQAKDVKAIESILKEIMPDIIHTHFDGFDISVAKALANTGLKSIQIWHLHNCQSFLPHPLKALYQSFFYFLHYNWYAKDVIMIGVGQHLNDFAGKFRKVLFYKRQPQFVIPNGIDTTRIRPRFSFQRHPKFTFLAYGGRNADKRIDYLLRACNILSEAYEFQVMITIGTDTIQVVKGVYPTQTPEWLRLVKQQEDICPLLDQVDCFISTSVHEGHSYAICEASIYGLPIIQSDIPGNKWNCQSPSAFPFRSEDVVDLARAMKEVMDYSDDYLKQRCLSARMQNMNLYNLDNWSKQICEVYSSIIV